MTKEANDHLPLSTEEPEDANAMLARRTLLGAVGVAAIGGVTAVRFRFMNEGQMAHPMHLHGMPFEVFARDGYPLPQPYRCDTVNVSPGERWDVIVVADEPGAWAFHCHILGHAEASTGMFGMVTALIVT